MIQQTLTVSFKRQLLEGVHNFRTSGNIFKIALYSSLATLNSSTTAYTTSSEIEATGYTAGGATLTNVNPSTSGTTALATFSTVTWNSSDITARGALIYNSNASGYTNPSVVVLDFGMDRSSSGSTFTITFPTTTNQYYVIQLANS